MHKNNETKKPAMPTDRMSSATFNVDARVCVDAFAVCNQKSAIQWCFWITLAFFGTNLQCNTGSQAPCGLRGCNNGPAPFPGWMSYKATKPGLIFVLYFSKFIIVLVFIRAPFYVLLVFIVCVVCLLVVLVKLSLLAKLLARKTPLSSESSPLQFLALV